MVRCGSQRKREHGGHFNKLWHTYFLIGFSSVRINKDVGPPPAGGSFLLGPPILSAKRWAPLCAEFAPLPVPWPASAAS